MLIVIDTTETFKEPLLTGPDWSLVKSLLSRDVATLVVPEVVVEESIKHYPDKLREALDESRRSLGRLRKLLPEPLAEDIPEIDVDVETAAYVARLSQRLLDLRARRPPYLEIGIMPLVRRSLARRRPFDGKGQRGFLDAVLWETIFALLRESDEKVIIVTGNTLDFGEHGSLTQHLVEDLVGGGFASDRVVVCAGIHRFVDEYAKPRLERLDEIQRQLQENEFDAFDAEAYFAIALEDITAAVQDHVHDWGFSELDHTTRGLLESPRLASLDRTPREVTVDDVYQVDDHSIAIALTYTVDGRVSCVESWDYGTGEPPFTTDFVGSARFTVEASIIIEVESGDVIEFAVSDVHLKPGLDWP